MAEHCSECNKELGFLDIHSHNRKTVCRDCSTKLIKIDEGKLLKKKERITEEIKKELPMDFVSNDDSINKKFIEIHNLVEKGIITENEFISIKKVLLENLKEKPKKDDLQKYG